jgi:phosphoribosyl-ATP pyrophosphohydrolase
MSTELDQLFEVIAARRGQDAKTSYTASLFADGRARIARKLGEEAVETVIEAMGDDTDALTSESADLLYHLLVLWADAGVRPEDVWAELARRRGTSGHTEKASRDAK